jgi:hypothetical protein
MSPLGFFGWLAGASDAGGDVSTSDAASARSDQRIREIRLSTLAIKLASASVFVARRSSSSSHWAVPISSSSSRSCRLTKSVLCGAGCATMTDRSCSIAASNCSVSAFRFRRAYSARKARPRSLAESVWQKAW